MALFLKIYFVFVFCILNFNAAYGDTFQSEITETISFLNSKKLLKEAIPLTMKGLSEKARNNLKDLSKFAGDTPMPYFSHYGNAVAVYSGTLEGGRFVVVSHTPFIFYVNGEIYQYENYSQFLEKFKSPVKATKGASLFNVFVSESEAQVGRKVVAGAGAGLLLYGAYRWGKSSGQAEAYQTSGATEVTVNNQIVMPDQLTIRSMNEKRKDEADAIIEQLSSSLVANFPKSSCQSKDLVPGAEVSYRQQNGVMTVVLKPKGEAGQVEFRFNEVTGQALNALCDGSNKCTEVPADKIGGIDFVKTAWEKTFKDIDAEKNRVIASIDDAFAVYRSKIEWKRINYSVEDYIKEKGVAYSRTTPIKTVVEKFSDPKLIERLRQEAINSRKKQVERSNEYKTGGSLLSWWQNFGLEDSDEFNPKAFREKVMDLANELANTGAISKWDAISGIVQGEFTKQAEAHVPITKDPNGKGFTSTYPYLMLSKGDSEAYFKHTAELDSQQLNANRQKEVAALAEFEASIKKVYAELGLKEGYTYGECKYDKRPKSRENDKILGKINNLKCNAEAQSRIKYNRIYSQLSLQDLSLSLKDFGACCSAPACKDVFDRKRTQLIDSNREMTRGLDRMVK